MLADAAQHLDRHRSTCCDNVLSTADQQFKCLDDFCQKILTIVESESLWRQKSNTNLMTLLRLYYSKEATDPRDKIYGLLGLVRDWGHIKPITPDYSVSVAQLYQETAMRSIAVTKKFECLTYRADSEVSRNAMQFNELVQNVKMGLAYYNQLPPEADYMQKYLKEEVMKKGKPDPIEIPFSSWAPNWAKINEIPYATSVTDRMNRALAFDACGGRSASEPRMLYTASPVLSRSAVLTASAMRVGKVGQFSHNMRAGRGTTMMPFLVNSMATISEKEFPLPLNPDEEDMEPYVAGGTRYEALCRAVCGDTFFASHSNSAGRNGVSMFRRATVDDLESIRLWRKWLFKSKHKSAGYKPPNPEDFEDQDDYQRALEANRAIRSIGVQRRFIVLDSGHVGMAPLAMAEDVIVILMGASTPVVLRPLGDIEVEEVGIQTLWIVVGECYLVGAMDGELLEQVEKQGKQLETQLETFYLV